MGVRTQQDRARERARSMVELLGRDDFDGLAGQTAELIGDGAADRDLFFPLLVEVTDACAQMIHARAPGGGPETAYVVDVADDDGEQVGIDELPPALRALLRGVLAGLEDHRDDELFQLDLAARDPDLRGRLDALVHGLMCVGALLREESSGEHAPEWLVQRQV